MMQAILPLSENADHEEINRAFDHAIKSLGMDFVGGRMVEYIHRSMSLGDINIQLAFQETAQGEDHDETAYRETKKQLKRDMEEYWKFVKSLPDEMQAFLALLAGDPELNPLNAADLQRKGGGVDRAILPLIQSIRPQNYIMQVDAISNHLAALEENVQLRVGTRGSQPVHTAVSLDIPEHMKVEGGALTTYDKSILNGVTSLMESGNMVFSIPMLYHAMTGKPNPTVDGTLYEELTSKLERMRRMMLRIDLTEESEAHYIQTDTDQSVLVEDLSLEGYLLPLVRVSGYINGKRADLYQIIQPPPIYTYAKMRRQLASVSIQLLDTSVNNNATTIPLKTYLLHRIELMKNKRNKITSTTILYKSIYSELDAEDAGKTKKMRIRNYTTSILESFAEKEYIFGYNEYRSGRSVAGVHILLEPPEPVEIFGEPEDEADI